MFAANGENVQAAAGMSANKDNHKTPEFAGQTVRLGRNKQKHMDAFPCMMNNRDVYVKLDTHWFYTVARRGQACDVTVFSATQ